MAITTKKLVSEITDQATNPPGDDAVLGAFYTFLRQSIERQDQLGQLLVKIAAERQITPKHFVNLIYRVYQYLKIQDQDLNFRRFRTPAQWDVEYNKLVNNPTWVRNFSRLLRAKSTTTTIYQRYAGVHAVIAHIFDQRAVKVIDLGCGGNYGLRGIELGEAFKAIEDQTPGKHVEKLLSQTIHLADGLAIDQEPPDNIEVTRWRLACSFYPQELDNFDATVNFESRIRQSQRVRFYKANLLALESLPVESADVVILSTMLYQLSGRERAKLIQKAIATLNEQGILIVQDFAVKNDLRPKQLKFDTSWFGRKFSYRTFIACKSSNWEFLEFLQWSNGRATAVKPGSDFNLITGTNYAVKTASAALAHSVS